MRWFAVSRWDGIQALLSGADKGFYSGDDLEDEDGLGGLESFEGG